MSDPTSRFVAWFSTRMGASLALAAAGLLVAWLAFPVFSVAYTEGFQPSIAIDAHALALHDPLIADELYPLAGRFYLMTRLGTSAVLLALTRAAGITGLQAFGVLNVLSLLAIVGSIVALFKRVYKAPAALCLLCCALLPAIFESAYLPNDDMPSAALVCLAFYLWWTKPTYLRSVIAGVLMGCAAALRVDALMVAPAFAILFLSEVKCWLPRAIHACIMGVLVVLIVLATYKLFNFSFLDSFATVKSVFKLMARSHGLRGDIKNDTQTLIYSITALGAFVWALGLASFLRRQQWRDLALATVVPMVYFIAYGAQLVQGRYLLPLSIFICLAMVQGFRSISAFRAPARIAALACIALGIVIAVLPPPAMLPYNDTADSDGPHFVVGRIWNPLVARWWQRRLNTGQSAIEAGIEQEAKAQHPLIVTGYWNSDRLVTLLLLEHHFTIDQAAVPAPCKGIAETYSRGSVVLTQIRTHVPDLEPRSEQLTWRQVGHACAHAAFSESTPALFVDSGSVLPQSSPAITYSLGAQGLPPLAPRSIAELPGMTVATLPVAAVDQAFQVRKPLNALAQKEASAQIARRLELLR